MNPIEPHLYAFAQACPSAFVMWWRNLWTPAHAGYSLRWFEVALLLFDIAMREALYDTSHVIVIECNTGTRVDLPDVKSVSTEITAEHNVVFALLRRQWRMAQEGPRVEINIELDRHHRGIATLYGLHSAINRATDGSIATLYELHSAINRAIKGEAS